MSAIQVGDRVTVDALGIQRVGVVLELAQDGDVYVYVTSPETGLNRVEWHPVEDLTRIGGLIQEGDHIQVLDSALEYGVRPAAGLVVSLTYMDGYIIAYLKDAVEGEIYAVLAPQDVQRIARPTDTGVPT